MKLGLNYRETEDMCPACGATAKDRKRSGADMPQGLSECPFCGTEKCWMCDMGDDVECNYCEPEE